MTKTLTIWIGIFLLAGCSTGNFSPVEKGTAGRYSESALLQGAWELYQDDEYEGKAFPEERLYFHKSGQLLVDGPDRICGRYDISGNNIDFIVPISGLEVVSSRPYKLDEKTLRLANRRKGFAHYKRIDGMLENCRLDEAWAVKRDGKISFRIPPGWLFWGFPTNSEGIQQVKVANADGSKFLVFAKLPPLEATDGSSLRDMFHKIAEDLLTQTPLSGKPLQQVGVGSLYGIEGYAFMCHDEETEDMIFKAVGKTLENATVLLVVCYIQDRLHELEHIAKSIYIDGNPLSSKFLMTMR